MGKARSEIKSKGDAAEEEEPKRIMFSDRADGDREKRGEGGKLRELSISEALGFLLNSRRFRFIRDRAPKVIAVSFASIYSLARSPESLRRRRRHECTWTWAHPISPMLIDSASSSRSYYLLRIGYSTRFSARRSAMFSARKTAANVSRRGLL